MKRLTDVKPTYRKVLQSLPLVLAAIAFVIYGLSFLPRTEDGMRRGVALVECVSYYRLCADGRPVAWFRSLDDSCMAGGMRPVADSTVKTRTFATAGWVDRWAFFPSCHGMMLIVNGDSTAAVRLAAANADIRVAVERMQASTAEDLELTERKIEETDYYMRVHNVNDDGYNVMAEYSALMKTHKADAEKLLAALKATANARRVVMERITEYTLLRKDTAGNVTRTACNVLTADAKSPFLLLQTAGRRKPGDASPVYLHAWLTPSPALGDSLLVASYPGCSLPGFDPRKAGPAVFGAAATAGGGHDLPRMLAPDGSLVFNSCGQLVGISVGGKITKPGSFGFGLKKLLP